MRTFATLLVVLCACEAAAPVDQRDLAVGEDEPTNVYLPVSHRSFTAEIPVRVTVEGACNKGGTAVLDWSGAATLGAFAHRTTLENYQNGCPGEASQVLVDASGQTFTASVRLNLVESYLYGPDDDCHRGWDENLAVQFEGNELVFQDHVWVERDVLTYAQCAAILAAPSADAIVPPHTR